MVCEKLKAYSYIIIYTLSNRLMQLKVCVCVCYNNIGYLETFMLDSINRN